MFDDRDLDLVLQIVKEAAAAEIRSRSAA
jgi:hypothetical protein